MDMSTAVPGTLLLIGLLFYLLHREWISLILLLATLFGVMVWTALAGSAILSQLNVVSLGFASILLGLAEDFGIVLHQEFKSHPTATAAEIRRIAGPGIFWSALTTAAAFALLNLSALPGLRHLGTLVALGVATGAWSMLFVFLPLMVRFGSRSGGSSVPIRRGRWIFPRGGALALTSGLLLGGGAVLFLRPLDFNSSPDVLRPRESEASRALQVVQKEIGVDGDPLWLLVEGPSVATVRHDLEILDAHLSTNASSAGLESYTLPLAVWPDPLRQAANLPVLQQIASDAGRITNAILAKGFSPEALELSLAAFGEWSQFRHGAINWPNGRVAEWVLPRFAARGASNYIALGLLRPGTEFHPSRVVPPNLGDSVTLSGWSLLGRTVLRQVQREIPMISGLVGITVIAALWLSFRRFIPVLLSLAVLAFSGVLLLACMSLLGWRWNLINLTALPLLLGMGIDYSIHIQTALDRFRGDSSGAFHSVGRALLLAGSTTIIGFTFLAFSSNAGMSSLGQVCALGLTILLLTSVFLLPYWRSPR
jgi:predicted exporter